MTDAPAFDFYPERFWFAVEGWTEGEICRYWRLLGQQWMRDGLPSDVAGLSRLARGKVSPRLLEKFPIASDGKRRNPFMEKLRGEQKARIAKAKDKSRRMHEARYGQHQEHATSSATSNATSSSQALLEGCPPPTTHLPPLEGGSEEGALSEQELRLLSSMRTMCERRMWPLAWAETFFFEYRGKGWVSYGGAKIVDPLSYFKGNCERKQETENKKKIEKAEKEKSKLNGKSKPYALPEPEAAPEPQNAPAKPIERMSFEKLEAMQAEAARTEWEWERKRQLERGTDIGEYPGP